jgi:hypothetical protein
MSDVKLVSCQAAPPTRGECALGARTHRETQARMECDGMAMLADGVRVVIGLAIWVEMLTEIAMYANASELVE